MSAYVTQFAELIDQMSSYSTSTDPLYYTMRFIDGLKPEICSVVLMQRPKDLDTACTLALSQEEVAVPMSSRPSCAGDWSSSSRTSPPSKYNVHVPPRQDQIPVTAVVGDSAGAPTPDSKLAVVKSYRRAIRLCYRCAGKWSKDHKCLPEILLAVADLWDFEDLTESPPLSPDDGSPPEHLFLALSKAAAGSSSSSVLTM